ncbi:universal stress protein [Kribbella speibonae]|uniref:Universal stress protein n=1 Tax=Kribbella speibonae TaxID=1572660 RepID=A0ABY2A8P8_9ACTN|nr:universal stress protein [Kribbella speibonae]TCC24837.1 universal stress protein [Kribbella speibonae]
MDTHDCVVVCGVDGSAAGERAVEWAVDEALRRGCGLRAVTVWSWNGPDYGTTLNSAEEARNRAVDLQNRVLEKMVGERREPGVERLVMEGRPSEQICDAALDAELIVLGSHGHGAFHDALVGSTSLHVIRNAPCPVVVVPDPPRAERRHRAAIAHHRRWSQGGVPMF